MNWMVEFAQYFLFLILGGSSQLIGCCFQYLLSAFKRLFEGESMI